jgi:Ca2+-binding EF-hand superfamily protein
MNEVKTVRKSIRPLTQEEAERMGRRPSSADQPSHTLSRRELEGFRQAFSFLDKNHNGSISAKEVHNLTKRFQGTKPDSAALQARVRRASLVIIFVIRFSFSQHAPVSALPLTVCSVPLCQFEASPYINKQGELVEEAFIQAVNDKRASGGVSLEEVRCHAVAVAVNTPLHVIPGGGRRRAHDTPARLCSCSCLMLLCRMSLSVFPPRAVRRRSLVDPCARGWTQSGRVFKLLDADGDGLISRNDMGMALLAMGESTSDGEIKAMMRTFDINSDGHLDEAEFNRLINSFSAPSAMLEANSAT